MAVALGFIEPVAEVGVRESPLFVPVVEGRIGGDGGASRGVGWADFDSDGDPDLVVSNTNGQWNAFYRKAPESFRKESDPGASPGGAVAAAAGNAEGVAWVDIDGDGDLDLHIVTRGEEPDLLFDNRGEEGLVRLIEGHLLSPAGRSMACWADLDGDGWLDVFLVGSGEDQRNALFRNHGAWRFEEAPLPPEAVGTGAARACSWGDPDDDGLPDLYVANAREPNVLLRNRGAFRLESDLDAGHAVEHVGYSYGVSWADFDGDGHQDLFVANFDVENALYRNDGTGRLERVTEGAIATEEGGASKGHAWGDYDLDGRLDLFVANGTYRPDMRNFLYLNREDEGFERIWAGEFAAHADTSAGAAWADIDGDGDLDLFVANWGSGDQVNRLYRNTASETTGRAWIGFRLRAEGPNTQAWGARLRARAVIRGEPRWMSRWNVPTTGYASQNQLLVHFGLGDAERVDSLVVQWPSGRKEVHTDLEARRYWTLVEGGRPSEPPRSVAQQVTSDETVASVASDIHALVLPQAEAELVSGVILVAQGEQILFERAYGFANWELRTSATPSTRFGIASITKPMTELVVQSLARAGRLDLEAPVETYLPGFPRGPEGGAPTVRHLLTHRAGVPHRVTDAAEETQGLSPAAIVERVEATGLLFEPGSRRLYSSAGFTCLARVIEVVEDKPFDAVLAERVFRPAGMTSATGETGQRLLPRRAMPYRLGADDGRLVVKNAPYKDLRFLTGAGSVYATPRDLLRLVRAVESGAFGSEAAERAFSGDPTAWRGWTGRTNGYEAFLDVLPAEGLVFVFLNNLQSAANWQLRDRIRNLLVGQPAAAVPLPPPVAEPFEDPEALVGSYGPAEIRLEDGALFRGDNEFYPVDGQRYYIPASGTVMRFRRDSAGTADAIVTIGGDGEERILPRSEEAGQ